MIESIHIHPFIVHFPIALIVVGAIFKVISLFRKDNEINEKISNYLLFIGTATAVLAQLSGMFLTSHPQSGDILEIFEQHELFALITIICLIATSLLQTILTIKNLKNSSWRFLVLLLYLLSVIFVLYTGYLGGTMVFDYMKGL